MQNLKIAQSRFRIVPDSDLLRLDPDTIFQAGRILILIQIIMWIQNILSNLYLKQSQTISLNDSSVFEDKTINNYKNLLF